MPENSVPDSPTHPGPAATVSAAVAAALTVGLLFGVLDAVFADLDGPPPRGWSDTLGCYAGAVMSYSVVGAITLVLAALLLHPLLRRLCARARLRRLLILGLTAGLFVEIELRLRPLFLEVDGISSAARLGAVAAGFVLAAVGGVVLARGMMRWPAPVHAALRGLAVAAIVGGFLFASGEEARDRERGAIDDRNRDLPNVLWIVAERWSPAELGCYGAAGIPTPHVDSVAERGVLVERCVAQSPTRQTSLRSIATGLHPRHHDAGRVASWPEEDYTTAFFPGRDSAVDLLATEGSWSRFRSRLLWPAIEEKILWQLDGDRANNLVRDWLEENESRRWFAMVYLSETEGDSGPSGAAGIDERIGGLLAALSERDRLEETLVVITATRGGNREGRDSLAPENLHIPLVLAKTSLLPHGARVGGVVESIDLLPTLNDLLYLGRANVPSRKATDGRSFLDAALGAQRGEARAYYPKEHAVAEGPLRLAIHARNGSLTMPKALLGREDFEELLGEPGMRFHDYAGAPRDCSGLLPEERAIVLALWVRLRRWHSNTTEPTGAVGVGERLPPDSLDPETREDREE